MTINPRDLDNYITGHYGEDFFTPEQGEGTFFEGEEMNVMDRSNLHQPTTWLTEAIKVLRQINDENPEVHGTALAQDIRDLMANAPDVGYIKAMKDELVDAKEYMEAAKEDAELAVEDAERYRESLLTALKLTNGLRAHFNEALDE